MFIKTRTSLLVLGDILALYLALAITLFVRYGSVDYYTKLNAHLYPFSLVFLLWVIVFYIFDLYNSQSIKNRLDLSGVWILAVLTGFLISIMSFYIFGSIFGLTPKTNLIIFTLLFGGIGFLWRILFLELTKIKKWQTKFAILGDSKNLEDLLNTLDQNPNMGYKKEIWIKEGAIINIDDTINQIIQKNIELLIIHPEYIKKDTITNLSYRLLPLGIKIKSFIDFYEEINRKVPLEDIEEAWFIKEIKFNNKFYNISKRLFDLILSIPFLIILSPVFVIIAILIKTTSPGPIIFKQIRVGRNNKNFTLYKFRTMTKDAEKGGAKWAEKNDTRITKFGKFLRHTHLDEAPQLWNMLRGNISFVGPRPERPEFTTVLNQEIPHYDIRHIVKPGITGWAQINYRYGASIEDAAEKLKYELYYIKRRSLVLDSMIILKTVRKIFINHR